MANLERIISPAEAKVVTNAIWFKEYCNEIRGLSITVAPGCYDLLHIGHIRHLEQASKFGDVLVVVVTADEYAAKGPGRPAFNQAKRMECLASLGCVSWVIPGQLFGGNSDVDNTLAYLKTIKPRYWVRGREYQGVENCGIAVVTCRECGGEDVYTDIGNIASSSQLVNEHFSTVPEDATKWLKQYKSKFKCQANDFTRMSDYLENCKLFKVLVAGEYIKDEYVWVKTLGKSGKEPIMAVEELGREEHNGGHAAVANHVKGFVDNVDAYTGGDLYTKTRYVEKYPQQKVFEVYRKGNVETIKKTKYFDDAIRAVDLVIVVDYGHGMLDDNAVQDVCENSKFLAVNVQTNAGNQGFNLLSKYPRADFVSISEAELRLDARQKNGDLKLLVEKAANRMSLRSMVVTRGNEGVLCWARDHGFACVPAFTDHFVDRIGAGDAVLAITSLLVYQNAPPDVIGLMANATGALAVKVVGNRESVNKQVLLKYVKGLLA